MSEPRAVEDPAELADVYERILAPSFPQAELVLLEELQRSVASGATEVLALGEDRIAAVAIGDRAEAATLLSYLAVDPGHRAGGLGGALLDAAVRRWTSGPEAARIVLIEVERPDRHAAHPVHGDPVRRLAFYRRHGARALDAPYFQPELQRGAGRAHNMLLLATGIHPDDSAGDRLVRTRPVVELMEGYFAATEGTARPRDSAAQALFAALDRPDGIPLLDPADYSGIAASAD